MMIKQHCGLALYLYSGLPSLPLASWNIALGKQESKTREKRMSSSSTLKGNGKKKKKSFVFAEIGTFLVLCFKGIWSNKNNSFVGIDPMQ